MGGILKREAANSAEQAFELRVRDVLYAIELRLRENEQVLRGGAGLFNASTAVSSEEWRAYIEGLRLGEGHAGMQGVGFSQLIPQRELAAHIAAMRAEGHANYRVHPEQPARPLYTSILFIEPFSGRNLAAFGYDMMSEPVRAKAMRQAVEQNRTIISGKVRLMQETHGKAQAGVLMYVPVYRKGLPLATAEQRWSALHGFVYSPFRMDDLMADILGQRRAEVDFSIFAGDSENPGERLFSSRDAVPSQGRRATFTQLRSLDVYGHTWTFRLDSRPEFEAQMDSPLPLIVCVLGGGISLLLFALVSFLLQRREQAAKIATRMTAEIRSSEQKLLQSEERLKAILDNIADGIITISEGGEIRSFNQAAERIFGHQEAELLGKNVSVLIPEPERSRHDSYLQAYRANGCSKNVIGQRRRVIALHRSGTPFTVELAVSEVWLERQRLLIGIVRNVSEQARIEEMNREFLSTISLELHTQLTSIRSSLALVAAPAQGRLPAPALQAMERALNHCERLIALVNDILTMETIEAGKMAFEPRPQRLLPLLEQALEANRPCAERFGVKFELCCEVPEAMLHLDGNRLLQVLDKLLSNAAKFSYSGGTVTVLAHRTGDHIQVEVQDRGRGIEEEIRHFIFDKFSQKYISDMRRAANISFDLCIAKSIVEQMGGSLDFVSRPSVLTTFYIQFPEHVGEASPGR